MICFGVIMLYDYYSSENSDLSGINKTIDVANMKSPLELFGNASDVMRKINAFESK